MDLRVSGLGDSREGFSPNELIDRNRFEDERSDVKLESCEEVSARLVAAAVFKTVGRQEKLAFGGFDSHTLPLQGVSQVVSTTVAAENSGAK